MVDGDFVDSAVASGSAVECSLKPGIMATSLAVRVVVMGSSGNIITVSAESIVWMVKPLRPIFRHAVQSLDNLRMARVTFETSGAINVKVSCRACGLVSPAMRSIGEELHCAVSAQCLTESSKVEVSVNDMDWEVMAGEVRIWRPGQILNISPAIFGPTSQIVEITTQFDHIDGGDALLVGAICQLEGVGSGSVLRV